MLHDMKSSLLVMLAVLVAIACWLMLRADTRVTPAASGAEQQRGRVVPGAVSPASDQVAAGRQAAELPGVANPDTEVSAVAPAIVGRIIDAAAQPVGGARVQVWPPASVDGREVVSVECQADGSFRVEVASGAWNLLADHAAHGKVPREGLRLQREDLQVGDLVLQAQPALLGRLAYADGQPIAELKVGVGPVGGSGASLADVRNERVLTDEHGRIAIRNLDHGEYELRLPFQSFRDEVEPRLRLTTGQAEQELVVDRHRIRLRNGDDLGIKGWRESRAKELQDALRSGNGWKALWDDANLWAAGQVSDSLVARGSWWYLSNSVGDKWGEAVVHADRARNETDVEMKLRRVEMSGTLRLRVRAADGTVPTSAEMSRFYAVALNSPEFQEAAPRDGDDSLFRVAPGRFAVVIRLGPSKDGFETFAPVERQIQVRANEETLLEAVARTGGRVQMTVHLPSGEKGRHLSGFQAATLDESGNTIDVRPYQTKTERGYIQGTPRSATIFTCVRILRPGRHEFTVTVKGYEPLRVSAFLEDGKTTHVDVYLR